MTFQEKSAYLNLGVILLLFGGYVAHQVNEGASLKLGGLLLLLITVQIIANSLLGIFARNRVIDERDRLVKARSRQVAYAVLFIAVWGIFGYAQIHSTVDSLLISNIAIVAVLAAEASGLIAELISYRVGF